MSRYKVIREQKNAKGDWACPLCKMLFRTRAKMYEHKKQEHQLTSNKWETVDGKRKLVEGTIWNKGLTIDDSRIQQIVETRKNSSYVPWNLGKEMTDEHKAAISNGMKIAHQEKRAHNIGSSRWNNEHSWPEKWFIEVLRNELNMVEHVDYETEMPFDKYSLDFAWPEKKLCIEIDGEQHERFEEYKLRDVSKDALLKEHGWQVFRIKWKDCYHNPKQYIEQVKSLF